MSLQGLHHGQGLWWGDGQALQMGAPVNQALFVHPPMVKAARLYPLGAGPQTCEADASLLKELLLQVGHKLEGVSFFYLLPLRHVSGQVLEELVLQNLPFCHPLGRAGAVEERTQDPAQVLLPALGPELPQLGYVGLSFLWSSTPRGLPLGGGSGC